MENDHADDAEEQAQAMEENQDNGGPNVIEDQEVANVFDVSSLDPLQAAIENRPDVLKRLIKRK